MTKPGPVEPRTAPEFYVYTQLTVSEPCYREIAAALAAAGYTMKPGRLEMHGIALVVEAPQ